jgi:hypothetical protein
MESNSEDTVTVNRACVGNVSVRQSRQETLFYQIFSKKYETTVTCEMEKSCNISR